MAPMLRSDFAPMGARRIADLRQIEERTRPHGHQWQFFTGGVFGRCQPARTAQYRRSELRPKFSLFYSHIRSEAYGMNGTIFGFPIDVTLPSSRFNYGITEMSTKINRIFGLGKGAYIMPYAELAIRYDFERPNDGEMLTGNLTVATPSPWAGSARAGFRMSIASAWLVEANAGYLSLGQNGLDVWKGVCGFLWGSRSDGHADAHNDNASLNPQGLSARRSIRLPSPRRARLGTYVGPSRQSRPQCPRGGESQRRGRHK